MRIMEDQHAEIDQKRDQAIVYGARDKRPRWEPGERLYHLFEQRCDQFQNTMDRGRLAVEADEYRLTYAELDGWANQLARYLLAEGVRPGQRVGLLFDDAVLGYASMLAVLKIHAAYVPLDVGFPAERVAFIAEDANISHVLTQQHLADRLSQASAVAIALDADHEKVVAHECARLSEDETGPAVDELAYVIYTSGSTGTPKGVAVEHASICNFVRVAAENYGYRPDDRVYQGLTIAFDFAVEEIWVPWMAGATLVPKPSGVSLVGDELGEFLAEQEITALCCVPTLLASVDTELPELRLLLVSGEACPQDLVERWWRPHRRFLNVYGPTEATVTATWTLLQPGKAVTLGVPLPTYSVVILDPETPTVLAPEETGEIAIGGIGLAREYLNRPERTAQSFIPDFLGLEQNPSGRLYRTGDLGTLNAAGEIEYHGRIDTQVKIRGYRIELTEIESVLLQIPGIAQAVVDTYDSGNGVKELVAYYSLRGDVDHVDPGSIHLALRDQLPGYMVPSYLEQLATVPLMASGKADRKSLPAPTSRLRAGGDTVIAARTATERTLLTAMATVLDLPPDELSVTADLFADLGINSLLLARFRAQLREDEPGRPPVSMRQIYQHASIEALAAALDEIDVPPEAGNPAAATRATATPPEPAPLASNLRYALCGIGQLAALAAYFGLLTTLLAPGFGWVADADGLVASYGRAVLVGLGLFVVLCVAPVGLKWLLIGRWKATEFPLWGWNYLRFWIVKTLLRTNPMMLFVGTPVYPLYLRALGARIGNDVLILSRYMPVCTDLLTIGAHSVVRKDAYLNGYRGQSGRIQTGRVTLGEKVLVGEGSVLDIDTELGDHVQLAHSSTVHSGRRLPAFTHWHGSPAEQTTVDYLNVDRGHAPSPVRKTVHTLLHLLPLLAVYLPVGLGGIDYTVLEAVWNLQIGGPSQGGFYLGALLIATVLFTGTLTLGCVMIPLLSRLLDRISRPGRLYPMYGLHYGLHRYVFQLSNSKLYMRLFGDSSFIVPWLRAVGYRLKPVRQTGSNFGVQQQHETPFLTSVGTGTMVSDGLSMINAWHSSTSFRLERATLGTNNFVGNIVRYPSGGRTGDNCLLATKVLVPLDGEVRENTGLLGSPAFEIPRSVQRDEQIAQPRTESELRQRVVAKTRHNAVTLLLYLAALWVFCVGLVTASLLVDYAPVNPVLTACGFELIGLFLVMGYFALLERASLGFRRLRPQTCSIYDRAFWRHERFWKFAAPLFPVIDGTPFKPMLLRLLGVRVGRQVFDDGCGIPEKTLVTIGDGCALNMGTFVQAHSLEDGGFKSDYIVLEPHCTLRTGAFVHYGATVGRATTVDADSFLMKGEETGRDRLWRGNPAQEIATPAEEMALPAPQPAVASVH